jgi:hypothetical protein
MEERSVTGNDRQPQRLVHEFNNLVFVVSAYTEEMLRQIPEDHPIARDLTIVADAVRRMEALSGRIRALEQRAACSANGTCHAGELVESRRLAL